MALRWVMARLPRKAFGVVKNVSIRVASVLDPRDLKIARAPGAEGGAGRRPPEAVLLMRGSQFRRSPSRVAPISWHELRAKERAVVPEKVGVAFRPASEALPPEAEATTPGASPWPAIEADPGTG